MAVCKLSFYKTSAELVRVPLPSPRLTQRLRSGEGLGVPCPHYVSVEATSWDARRRVRPASGPGPARSWMGGLPPPSTSKWLLAHLGRVLAASFRVWFGKVICALNVHTSPPT